MRKTYNVNDHIKMVKNNDKKEPFVYDKEGNKDIKRAKETLKRIMKGK